MRPMLQGSVLTKSPEGRKLYQLFEYENNAGTKLAREAVRTLERTLEADVELVARALARSVLLVEHFANYLAGLYDSLREVHKISNRQKNYKHHHQAVGPSHGPRLVPNVSAGLISYDMEGESLLVTSELENDDKEYDVLTQRTQDEVSSIYTYDIVNSYIMPKPRAGQESDSGPPSPASKSSAGRSSPASETPEDTKSDSLSGHEDSGSGSQDVEQDNNKIQGIGDPNKGRATISDQYRKSCSLRQISSL